jgi:hypothetical protein
VETIIGFNERIGSKVVSLNNSTKESPIIAI